MARPSFTFWEDYYNALSKLPTDAARGRFIMGMCEWAFTSNRPDFSDDPVLDMALTMVEGSIEESVAIRQRSSDAGKKSGETRRRKSAKKNEHPSEGCSEGCSNTPSNVSKYVSKYVPTRGEARLGSPPAREWPKRPPDWTQKDIDEWDAWAKEHDPETFELVSAGKVPAPWAVWPK